MSTETASPDGEGTTVHPSAIVLPGVELGRGVEIGPYCYLEPGVEIGDGCRLGPHVHLLGRVQLGAGSILRSGAVVGGEPQDDDYRGERTWVRLGEGCQLHEHTTVHRATGEGGETVLGAGVRMMAGSHVGHNGQVGDGVVMVNSSVVGGHASVGDHAILSAFSGIHQFGRVGRLTLLGANAGMNRDAPPFSIVAGGYPTRWRGPNSIGMKRAGMSADDRNAVRQALHRCFTSEDGPRAVAEELATSDCAEVAELADFILTSKRGVCAGMR